MSVLSADEPMGYRKPVQSVGDEFMAWAETYWNLEEVFSEKAKEPQSGEVAPYDSIRRIFVKKINDIINQRIDDYL